MISTSLFSTEGDVWNQTFVFGPTFELNKTALAIEGLPQLTGSYVWYNMTASWGVRFYAIKTLAHRDVD